MAKNLAVSNQRMRMIIFVFPPKSCDMNRLLSGSEKKRVVEDVQTRWNWCIGKLLDGNAREMYLYIILYILRYINIGG